LASNFQAQFIYPARLKIVVAARRDAMIYMRASGRHMKIHSGKSDFYRPKHAGASTMIAANYVYNVANPTLTFGSTLLRLFRSTSGRKKFSLIDKFVWLELRERIICSISADSPIKLS